MRRSLVLALLGIVVMASTWAQAPTVSVVQFANRFARQIEAYPPLQFASQATEMGFFGARGNAVYRPSGTGPFPAVVLVHTCGGLEPHITERARDLLSAGFVVLVLDAQGPRNVRSCDEFQAMQVPLVARDSFAALRHLAEMPDVDAERISLLGLSLGSFVAAAVASPEVAAASGSGKRFRSSVGWYGSCALLTSRSRWQILSGDSDRPVLLLLAGKDSETPIAECFPLLEDMKSQGRPVSWHVYPDATHAWDKTNMQRGYFHHRATVADAMHKTIEFLRRD